MTAENFDRALSLVLVHEGGYVNHPADPGGATNKGVTQKTYDAWRRGKGKPTQDVRKITADEIAAIYRQQYWQAVRGDELPSGVDYAVFDYGVNSGPARAAKDLQRVLGVRADGVIGANTLAAIHAHVPSSLVSQLCDRRMAFLKSLKHWSTFGKGWTRRVNDVRAEALAMAGTASPASLMDTEGPGVGSAKADPADLAMSRTPEATGGALAGVGALGSVISDQAQALSPVADISPIIRIVFALLLVAGVGLTIWASLRRLKERDA